MNLYSKFDFKSISLVSVLLRCGIQLRKAGNYYICNCPLHTGDTTPSFVVYSNNSWTCFGKCSYNKNGHRNGGDSIEFLKQFYNFSFSESVNWLKQNFIINDFEPVVIEQKKEVVNRVVPHPWVIYWHSLLGENRQYFNSRGFSNQTIDTEFWGFDGHRYTIPVWEDEPGNSQVLGVRRRKQDTDKGSKYLGLKDMNSPTVWGRWHCRNKKTIFAFAGEFDAALANQDGFPSFSVVNGIEAISDFPKEWPDLWFPNSQRMIAVFDRKEEPYAGRLCQAWNRKKGSMQARIFSWPLGDYKDYCEFRKEQSASDFSALILKEKL